MLSIGMQWDLPNSALLRSLETADNSISTVMSTKSGPIFCYKYCNALGTLLIRKV